MNKIRQLREQRGMQQKELALELNVSQPTVSDWEAGRKIPSAKSTMKLAKFFSVSVEYLMGDTEETATESRPITDAELKFALFDGDQNITDAQFEEVKRFAQFIRERDRRDK